MRRSTGQPHTGATPVYSSLDLSPQGFQENGCRRWIIQDCCRNGVLKRIGWSKPEYIVVRSTFRMAYLKFSTHMHLCQACLDGGAVSPLSVLR